MGRINSSQRVLMKRFDHWIELLKGDKRAFFTACSKASRAADYLRGLALAERAEVAA
jgi:antirestriction protein ArdC